MSMFIRCTLALALGGLWVPGAAAAPAAAATPSAQANAAAQAELQAIRRALVDEALDGPTRVRAWAWIDAQGALHERNEVSADMQVRGVRVREYVHSADAPALSIESKMARSNTSQCRYAQGHWRLPMTLETNLDAVRSAELRALALNAAQLAQQAWAQTVHAAGRYQTAARQVDRLNPYQRALLGALDSETGWRALWTLQAEPVPILPLGYVEESQRENLNRVAKPNVADLSLALQIVRQRKDGAHASHEVVLQRSQALRVELINAGWSAPRLDADSQQRVAELAQQWGRQLQLHVACDPLQYDVTDVRAQFLRINGGTAAGLQVGDRLVVMDAARVATQVWDSGSLEHVAIARVQRVDAYGAALKTVAGTMPQGDGRLVALPY